MECCPRTRACWVFCGTETWRRSKSVGGSVEVQHTPAGPVRELERGVIAQRGRRARMEQHRIQQVRERGLVTRNTI